MSRKRSELLRDVIAEQLADAAEEAAAVSVIGAGAGPKTQNSVVTTPDSRIGPANEVPAPSPVISAPPTPIAAEPQPSAIDIPPTLRRTIQPPETTSTKTPSWQKISITLAPQDFDILSRLEEKARRRGVKMRKGGNPSLIVRTALRLLDELQDEAPEAWLGRIAATADGYAQQGI